jgi:hypothetical protein
MSGVAFADDRFNAAVTQLFAMRLRIVSAIGQQVFGSMSWRSDLAGHLGHTVDHRNQLLAVVFIGFGDFCDQRSSAQVGEHMVLTARSTAIDRAGAGVGAPKKARTYDASAIIAAISSSPAARSSASSSSCS